MPSLLPIRAASVRQVTYELKQLGYLHKITTMTQVLITLHGWTCLNSVLDFKSPRIVSHHRNHIYRIKWMRLYFYYPDYCVCYLVRYQTLIKPVSASPSKRYLSSDVRRIYTVK